jgi:hypothetical protein
VREGLRVESSAGGLALMRARASIVVIPFDGPEACFAGQYGTEMAGVGKAGRLIAWDGDPRLGRSDFVVSTVDGKPILRAHESGNEFVAVALSEAGGRFTYLRAGSPGGQAAGLYWTSFDFSQGGFVDTSEGDSPQGDWSPDGNSITYEKGGGVRIFDVPKGSSRALVEGHDPTWGPSGDRISFRAPDGRAALVTTEGAPVDWPVGAYHTLSPIRWSPDGLYVAFSEERPLHIPLVGAYYDLLVCRAADGRAVVVRKFGAGSGDLQGFYWILDYRHFCTGCKRGEPFN